MKFFGSFDATFASAEERQARLRQWNFDCTCEVSFLWLFFCEIHSPMEHVSKLILFVDHHGFVKILTIARFAIFQRRNLQEMTKVGEQSRSTTNLFPVTWQRGRFIGAHVTNYIKSYQKCSFPRLIEHWPQQPRRWIWCVKSNLAWRQRCPRLSWRWRQCSQTWAYL